MVILKDIRTTDYKFLYTVLEEREENQKISFVMPTYEDHVIFWSRLPYQFSYIITDDTLSKSIGYIYLTHNKEIGIFLLREHKNKGFGDQALNLFFEKHDNGEIEFIANMNPDNNESKQFFSKHGFKMIQHTYKRDKKKT